jgi:hypothetical protein
VIIFPSLANDRWIPESYPPGLLTGAGDRRSRMAYGPARGDHLPDLATDRQILESHPPGLQACALTGCPGRSFELCPVIIFPSLATIGRSRSHTRPGC